MEFSLHSELDFQQATCTNLPMTMKKAWVVIDKFRGKLELPVQSGDPWSTFLDQLENSVEKHTVAVQQETKIPVSRTIQVQIYHGDPSETKGRKSAFLRIIDDYSRDKQYGILGQLISVSGGSDNVTADLILEFGTANDKDKMTLDLTDKRIVQCKPTMNAHEVTHWFDFTESMVQSWTGNGKFSGTLTLKLQLNDMARDLIRLDALRGTSLLVLRKMLEDAGSTGDGFLVTANGSRIPCHKAVLMAQSDVFKAMFTSGMKEQTSSTVELDDMTESGVRALLAYFYSSDIAKALKDCSVALELFKAADKYGINNLHEVMKDVILNKEAIWCTVSTAINLWLFARKKGTNAEGDAGGYKEIEKKAIDTLRSKTQKQLDNCPEFQEMMTCPQFAKELCVYLLLNK